MLLDRPFHGQALGQVERHRLLQVDILARLAGIDRLQRVPVWRRCDDDRVNVLLFEQFSVVVVRFRLALVLGDGRVAPFLPHITNADDGDVVVLGTVPQISAAHPSGADQAELNLVVGARLAGPPQCFGGNKVRGGGPGRACDRRLADETAPREFIGLGHFVHLLFVDVGWFSYVGGGTEQDPWVR